MSVSTSIKQTLITRINNLASVQATYGYERNNPTGFPAVLITSADMDGEFTSTTENRRYYAYRTTVLMPVGQQLEGYESLPANEVAEDVISGVIEDIIDDLDSNFTLPDNSVNVLYTEALDAQWGFVQHEGGMAKAGQLTIRVVVDYEV